MRPCVILFRHFFVLVKSGKGKDEVGAYYFQSRSDQRTPYIPGLVGGKWEEWRKEWVIATTEANERLVMPTEGPASDRISWRAKPSLPPDFDSMLGKIRSLPSPRWVLLQSLRPVKLQAGRGRCFKGRSGASGNLQARTVR